MLNPVTVIKYGKGDGQKIIVCHGTTKKTVSLFGTRMGGDLHSTRSVFRVCIRWAEMTGTSEACAAYAWRTLGFERGKPRKPARQLTEYEWSEILFSLDQRISELVNNHKSKFYIYG